MSVQFSHKSAPMVAVNFSSFTSMLPANEISTSSGTVKKIENMLDWKFASEDGYYCGEIPLAELAELICRCELALNGGIYDELLRQRVTELRTLAYQAIHYQEPINFG